MQRQLTRCESDLRSGKRPLLSCWLSAHDQKLRSLYCLVRLFYAGRRLRKTLLLIHKLTFGVVVCASVVARRVVSKRTIKPIEEM